MSTKLKIVRAAQDLIYGVHNGRKLAQKHIGLGCALHQATRSKQLVELFHNADHTASYNQIVQIDTHLAAFTLKSMDQNTGTILPPNIQNSILRISQQTI